MTEAQSELIGQRRKNALLEKKLDKTRIGQPQSGKYCVQVQQENAVYFFCGQSDNFVAC